MDINNNVNSNKLGGWVVDYSTHPLDETDIVSIFNNSNQTDIIFLLSEKKYTYMKEVNNLLMIDSRNVLLSLKKKGVIEEFDLTDQQKEELSLIKDINKNSLFCIKTYRLTNQAKILLQNPFIYSILQKKSNNNIKRYVEYLGDVYNEKMQEIEDKKQYEIERLRHRYNLAINKQHNLRNAEDLALINMFEEERVREVFDNDECNREKSDLMLKNEK